MLRTVGSIGAYLPLLIAQGEDFELPIQLTDNQTSPQPINLTGSTFEAQIRKDPADSAIVATFAVVAVDLPNGRIKLSLTRTQTGGMAAGMEADDFESTYHWDLWQIDTLLKRRKRAYGPVQVHRAVTRAP